jgi:D-sedoheptulose 7-phosphate isomerase
MMALGEASRRGLMTIGFAGYDGGQMAMSSEVGYCFVVRSQSIHRIQESQALLGYQLWATVQQYLMPGGAAPNRRGDTT